MIFLWSTPQKIYDSKVGDDLNRYIGIYNYEKGPKVYNNKIGANRCLLSLPTIFSGIFEGKSLNFSKDELEFSFEVKKSELITNDVLANDASSIIVNERVKRVLDVFASKNIQYLKPKIKCSDGELDNYCLVNILSRVCGIDKQKSKCEYCVVNPSEISGFEPGVGTLVYNHGCLGLNHIAKEKEFGTFVLVSQELKDALCALTPPVKEVSFVLPEEVVW